MDISDYIIEDVATGRRTSGANLHNVTDYVVEDSIGRLWRLASLAFDGVDDPSFTDARGREFLLSDLVEALTVADVYVDGVAGNDAHDGLTKATAKKTVAAGVALMNPGDSIALKRGSRLKETLTVGDDDITVLAYGARETYDADGYCTNAPILDGGAFVTTWSDYLGGAEVRELVDDFTGVAGTNLTAHTPNVGTSWAKTTGDIFTNSDMVISNANRLRRGAAANTKTKYAALPILGGDDYYVQADIYVASADTDHVEIIARGFSYTDKGIWLRLSGSSGGLAIGRRVGGTNTTAPAGAFATVAAALGGYGAANTYRIRLEVEGDEIRGFVGPTDGTPLTQFNTWTDATIPDGDQVMVQLGATTVVIGDDTHGVHVDHIEQGPLGVTGSPVNTYQAAVAPHVYTAAVNDQLSLKGPNTDQLDDGEFFWVGGVMYLRRDAGMPNDTDVVRASLTSGIDVGAHTGVTISGIGFEHQVRRAVACVAGASDLTIENCMAQLGCSGEPGDNGTFAGFDSGFVFTGNHVREVNNDALYLNQAAADAPQVTRNVLGPVTGFVSDGLQIDASAGVAINSYIAYNHFKIDARSPKGNLILFGDHHLVEHNRFEGPSQDTANSGGYGLSCAGNNLTFRYNRVLGAANQGLRTASPAATAWDVHHNVFIDNGQAIDLQTAMTAVKVYANTMLNVLREPKFRGAAAYVFDSDVTVTGEFKDNIIWDESGAGRALRLTAVSATFLRDYNLIGPAAASFYKVNNVSYATLAAVNAALTQEVHSVASTPILDADGEPSYLSPSKGRGVVIPSYVTAPDIGAL